MNEKQKILIVDDRPANIESLKVILAELDVDLVSAASGNDAVLLALQYDFDLILVDVQMPGMDGFEAVELIKMEEKNKLVPIIFQTAIHRGKENVIKGIESGAVDYITKPIVEEILIGKVKQFLLMQKNRKDLEFTKLQLEEKIQKMKEMEEELIRKNEELKELSITDNLTTLFNRRHFTEKLSEKLYDSNRYNQPLSLLMFDVDQFKTINDTYGHLTGDDVLIDISNILKNMLRKTDFAGRYGGDEFLVIFSNTPLDKGLLIAEKIKNAIKDLTYKEYPELKVAISGGITDNKNFPDTDSFIKQADLLLYKAKKNGRDKIESPFA